jgi:hypothetical protein
MADDAKALELSPTDLFEASRLLTSFMIGLLVGVAAALIYLLNGGTADGLVPQTLLGFVASGYLGTDFLEGFISQYLPQGAAGSTIQKKAAALLKTPPYTHAEALSLVVKVFEDRGRPGVTESMNLSDLGFANEINLLRLLAYINDAIQSPPHGKLLSTVVNNWQTVKDIVNSVQTV